MAFTTYVVYYEWNSGKKDRNLIERYSITDLREYLIKDLKFLKNLKRIHILYNRQKEIMWADNGITILSVKVPTKPIKSVPTEFL